jgi:hypothetical protein
MTKLPVNLAPLYVGTYWSDEFRRAKTHFASKELIARAAKYPDRYSVELRLIASKPREGNGKRANGVHLFARGFVVYANEQMADLEEKRVDEKEADERKRKKKMEMDEEEETEKTDIEEEEEDEKTDVEEEEENEKTGVDEATDMKDDGGDVEMEDETQEIEEPIALTPLVAAPVVAAPVVAAPVVAAPVDLTPVDLASVDPALAVAAPTTTPVIPASSDSHGVDPSTSL